MQASELLLRQQSHRGAKLDVARLMHRLIVLCDTLYLAVTLPSSTGNECDAPDARLAISS